MKKLICVILVLTMLAGLTVFASAEDGADARGTFVVSSPAAPVEPGEEFQLTVSLENNPGVASVELEVVFDEDVLEWTKVEQGEYAGLWDAAPGVAVTWFSNDDNWTNDGVFCTLTFKVKDDAKAGDTTVTVWYDEEEVYDWDEVNVPFDIEPGTVTVAGSEEPPAEGGKFVVSSLDEPVKPGDEFQLTVSLVNNPGVASVELEVVFDEDVLEWTKVEQGEYAGLWDAAPGVAVTWFSNDDNWTNDGVFCTLTFKVKDDAKAGDTTVTVWYDEEEVYDWDEVNVPFDIEPGTVTIEVPEVLTGYFLVGTLNEWMPSAEYKFEPNPENGAEYLLETGLAVNDEIKVVYAENGEIKTWYPDNAGNYVVDEAHAGLKTIYFKTTYDSSWSAFGGYIWIDAALTTFKAEVYGSSVSLKGDIALNFYLILPEELVADEAAYVKLNDKKLLVSKATTRTVGEDTLYQFTIALNAKQMNDEVALKVYTGEDELVPLYRHSNGEDLTETGYVYTVQDYIQKTLETSSDAKLKALVQAMSDFGSLAQLQFNYNTDNRAEVLGDLDSVTAETVKKYEKKVTAGAATGVSFNGGSLVLESQTTIRLYFALDEGEIGDYTFKVGTKTVTPTETTNGWMVEIPNISAKDLDKTYTVKVTSSAGTVLTVKYSGLSYAYSVLTGEDNGENLVNLVKGMVLYNKAADAYFG